MTATPPSSLISHQCESSPDMDALLQASRARLVAEGDLPQASVARQIELLEQLSQFELGRFLLLNRGLDAYWTHQLVTYVPGAGKQYDMSELERWIYEASPAALATRERFGIFREHLQQLLRPDMCLGSVPCGWMGELLLLDYSQAPDVSLVGVDLDQRALEGALAPATQRGLADRLALRQQDAWKSGSEGEFDVLASNGLNIYEPDDERVTALYGAFFRALKSGGVLVSSFLTPPPSLSSESPWNMATMDPQALALQYVLFARVIRANWNALRTHAQTAAQLERAGFTGIRFVDDRRGLFPTVIATKP